MRPLLAALLVGGCRIADVTFSGPGVGSDGGPGDSQAGDGGIDAPVSVGMLKGYIIDGQAGVFRVAKSGFTGELTLVSNVSTPVLSTGLSRTAVVGKAGDMLYVAKADNANAQLHAFAINATTGDLTFVNDFNGGSCPSSPVLHPNGTWIASGCYGPDYLRTKLTSTGSIFGTVLWPMTGSSGPTTTAFSPMGTCLYIGDASTTGGIYPYRFDATTGMHTAATSAPSGSVLALAIRPNGATLYAARSGSVIRYSLTTTCEMTLNPGSNTIGTTVHFMMVDPSGQYLFVLGDQIYSFTIASDGSLTPVTGSPFLSVDTYLHAIMDPEVPNKLYVTTPSGTFAAPLNAGVIGSATPVSTGGTDSRWFVLAP